MKTEKLYKVAAICGVIVTLQMLLILTVGYRTIPLVEYVFQTGIPVVYYGQVMVLLISGAIGLAVSLVILYFGHGSEYHRSGRTYSNKRVLGYGGVGFLTIVVPALLMDPAAMSVGIGMIIMLKMLESQRAETTTREEIKEKQPVPVAD